MLRRAPGGRACLESAHARGRALPRQQRRDGAARLSARLAACAVGAGSVHMCAHLGGWDCAWDLGLTCRLLGALLALLVAPGLSIWPEPCHYIIMRSELLSPQARAMICGHVIISAHCCCWCARPLCDGHVRQLASPPHPLNACILPVDQAPANVPCDPSHCCFVWHHLYFEHIFIMQNQLTLHVC